MKDILSGMTGKVPLFLTQEKALKKILQERERGDLAKARKTAVEALEKWPDDYDLAVEAAQACLDLSDYPQAANILKNAYKRHGSRRAEILEMARTAFTSSFSTLLGSFVVETLVKGRNLEGAAGLLKSSPESFVNDLVKRGETRSGNLGSEGQNTTAVFAENELLLGMLYMEAKQFERAVESLGHALEILPADAQTIGAVLVQIEQELPASPLVKYYLGLASLFLAHPDKAEARFFQCIELEHAPLERILSALESADTPGPNLDLLRGEILVRAFRTDEGVALIRAYVSPERAAGATPPGEERTRFAESRLAGLPEQAFAAGDVPFLYCDVASAAGLVKEALAVLERIGQGDASRAGAVIQWLERNEAVSRTAPGQSLLAHSLIASGASEKGARAARSAVEMNAALVPSLTELVRARIEGDPETDPCLKALLAELHARSGDRTSAEEVFGALKRSRALPDAELISLSGEIMRHSGVFLTGVIAALEIALAGKSIEETVPYVVSLIREKPEEDADLASSVRELAEAHEEYWPSVSELMDRLAAGEQLSPPLRFLQAAAHLFTGGVERAVFEFDQLLMLDESLRYRLIELYKKSLARFDANATLHLALYHLYLDEELLAEAAHHLCRTLELDPNQIRDVISRFGKLVEREPENLGIWEAMLTTALATNRLSLAKEVLARALAGLPREKAAALNVYGAKISAADGKWDEVLTCLSLSLTSPEADVRALEGEIRGVIARDPANAQAHFLLGETLLRLGRDAEGAAAIRRALEISPALAGSVEEKLESLISLSIEPWLLSGILGELAWLAGNTDEALRHFGAAQKGPRESLAPLSASIDRIRRTAPGEARLEVLYARNLALEGRHADAAGVLEDLVAADAGQTRTATDILLAIVAERSEQCEANRLLARIFTRAGDVAEARRAVIRILSDESADPARIDAVVSEFLADHETDPAFLVRYAGLKARAGAPEESLARARAALDRDPACADAVLRVLEGHRWPEELRLTAVLLRVDCLTALGRGDEAFALLEAFPAPDPSAVAEIVPRLDRLASQSPRRGHFSLGASLLAGAGRIEEAGRFIAKGTSLLGSEDALDLTIELAEILHNAGAIERASRLFAEALEASPAKRAVLTRIEASTARWADREIQRLTARLDDGGASEEDAARLVRLVLDRTGGNDALGVLSRSGLSRGARSSLLGAVYLSLDLPTLACAALDAAPDDSFATETDRADHRYLAGIARERSGDFARAAALFAAIAGNDGTYRDSRERALRNYARFLEASSGERAIALEKSGTI
jgi:tetratricopeptide (TPR) repeat protein